MLFFVKKVQKYLVNSKNCCTFAPAFDKNDQMVNVKMRKWIESVAQQVEHIPFKDGVLGSSPSWFTGKRVSALFFVCLSILSIRALQFCLQNYCFFLTCASNCAKKYS